MNLSLDKELAKGYRNGSQIARVLTEAWTAENMYCPVCGWPTVEKFPNNREAADFFCPHCESQFEQKSRNGPFGHKISDGAYHTLVERITGNHNPDFLLMNYSLEKMRVENLFFIPRYFFVPEVVEQRKPLAEGTRRAGWVGCNILLDRIPRQGRIAVVKDGRVLDKSSVLERVRWAERIRTKNISSRGWLMDVLHCVNHTENREFTLAEIYRFEADLSKLHPGNHEVRAKIRQQLQMLRDRGIIDFLGNGHYRKRDTEK